MNADKADGRRLRYQGNLANHTSGPDSQDLLFPVDKSGMTPLPAYRGLHGFPSLPGFTRCRSSAAFRMVAANV